MLIHIFGQHVDSIALMVFRYMDIGLLTDIFYVSFVLSVCRYHLLGVDSGRHGIGIIIRRERRDVFQKIMKLLEFPQVDTPSRRSV